MEIKYSCSEFDKSWFGKNLITGVYDKTGKYIKNNIPNLHTVKDFNTRVAFMLHLRTHYKNKTLLKELSKELEITKDFEKRPIKTLSTSELIKVQVIEAFLSRSKIIVLKDIDKYLNHRDLVNLIKALKNHVVTLNKTVVLESSSIDNIIAVSDRYLITENNKVLYMGGDFRQIPFNSSIKNFVELANAKGAKINNYKDESDLLKAIYRSVSKK